MTVPHSPPPKASFGMILLTLIIRWLRPGKYDSLSSDSVSSSFYVGTSGMAIHWSLGITPPTGGEEAHGVLLRHCSVLT